MVGSRQCLTRSRGRSYTEPDTISTDPPGHLPPFLVTRRMTGQPLHRNRRKLSRIDTASNAFSTAHAHPVSRPSTGTGEAAGARPPVPDRACAQVLPPGFSAALDVGYIPCAEAFLRRHMRGCMAAARRNPSDDPVTALALRLSKGQLLPLLLTHGDERLVAGLLTTLGPHHPRPAHHPSQGTAQPSARSSGRGPPKHSARQQQQQQPNRRRWRRRRWRCWRRQWWGRGSVLFHGVLWGHCAGGAGVGHPGHGATLPPQRGPGTRAPCCHRRSRASWQRRWGASFGVRRRQRYGGGCRRSSGGRRTPFGERQC